jgi:hypothetical protein
MLSNGEWRCPSCNAVLIRDEERSKRDPIFDVYVHPSNGNSGKIKRCSLGDEEWREPKPRQSE